MRIFFALALAVACLPTFGLDKETKFTGSEGVVALLLSSSDLRSRKSGAKQVFDSQGGLSSDIYELTAQALFEETKGLNYSKERSDLVAWLGKAIASSGDKKYQSFLEKHTAGQFEGTKVSKHISKALPNLTKESSGEFAPEEGLISSIQSQFSTKKNQKDVTDSFLAVNFDDTFDQVVGKLGYPDSYRTMDSGSINLPYGRITVTALELVYEGYGMIYLNLNSRGGKTAWRVDQVSNVYLLLNGKSEKDIEVGELLSSPHWISVSQNIARKRKYASTYDELVTDIAMERILGAMDSHSDYEEKMLANLVRFLEESNRKKYIAPLEHVLEHAPSRSVRKYAKRAITILEKNGVSEGESYIAGSTNAGKFRSHVGR